MNALNSLLLLASLLIPAASIAESSLWGSLRQEKTVWKSSKPDGHSVTGKIKAIVVDEDEDRIFVKVETASHDVQTLRVCNQNADSAIRTFGDSEKMNLMRQAFESGRTVRVSFESAFDRCLSSIDYSHSEKTTAAAASGGNI